MDKGKNVRVTLLSIAIAIVSLLFVIYGINTFYKAPEMNDFCANVSFRVEVEECTENDIDCFCGVKNDDDLCTKLNPEYDKCMQNFNNARDNFNMVIFIVMSIIGSLMVLGSFFIKHDTVSFGIMGGGILSILIGVLRNWSNVQDWMRFIILGVILAALVWIGYNKIKD